MDGWFDYDKPKSLWAVVRPPLGLWEGGTVQDKWHEASMLGREEQTQIVPVRSLPGEVRIRECADEIESRPASITDPVPIVSRRVQFEFGV